VKKKILGTALIVVLVSVAIFIFFGKRQATHPTVAFVVPTLTNPFFVQMKTGAESAIAGQKATLLFQATTTGVENQAAQSDLVATLVARGIKALCIVPADSAGILPALKGANNASVTVINVDNRVDLKKAAAQGVRIGAYIGSDNRLGGRLAGEYIIERLHGSGKVALLEGLVGSDAAIQRATGFQEALNKTTGVSLVAKDTASWSREQAIDKFTTILQAHPDLDALFAANDEMALGAAAALSASGSPEQRARIFIVGFDATPDGLAAIHDGRLAGSVAQQPEEMGSLCVRKAISAIEGATLEEELATPVKLITQHKP
jgi:ABC-type sugar transport system substrate-binding protein